MNPLEQIPEEKENNILLARQFGKSTSVVQQKYAPSKISTTNFSTTSSKKVLGNSMMQRVLSPTNFNSSLSKQNIKSKSQTFSFNPKTIKSFQSVAASESVSIEELEDQIQYFIFESETLIEHKKTCQQESRYVEAEMAKQRIVELKSLLEKRNKEDIKQRHTKEQTHKPTFKQFYKKVSEIEKAYLDEMDEFNAFWDKKIADFEVESSSQEQDQIQRHDNEMTNFIQDLERSLDVRPKDNTELLSLRKVEQELSKIEDFMQAFAIKQKIAVIENQENEKYQFERQKRMKNLIIQLKNKHQTELKALQKRIQAIKDEQIKLRSIEFEKLMSRFIISKKDLQSSQNVEFNKFSKSVKLGSVLQASRQVNQSQISNASFQKNLAIIKRTGDC